MELKILSPTDDGFIKSIEWNHEEIKQEVSAKVEMYKNLVYSDEQIKEAKSDRANLNKFVSALESKRKDIKKQCLEPYEKFEKQMKEIISIVNEPISLIDNQIKQYEDHQKQKKMDAIKEAWNSRETPDGLALEEIFDNKWLNASVSMKSIQDAMDFAIEKFNQDMSTLANLHEFGFEAQQVYIHSLDLNKALAEGQRMAQIAKAKAEREEAMRKIEEEQKAKTEAAVAQEEQIPGQIEFTDTKSFKECMNPPVEPAKQKQWVSFQAFLSTEDALALREFLNSRGIEFKAV